MGFIQAASDAVSGAKESQFLAVVEPENITEGIVFARGVEKRKGLLGQAATRDTIANGSIVHVYPNQCAILVDGGKIVDYCAQEGYFTLDQSSQPSLFNGELDAVVEDTYRRICYGGITPSSQRLFYVNLQEMSGLKFGTRSPLNYYDSFYDAELFLKTHGTYSVRITDPLLFYREVVPKGVERLHVDQFGDQFLSEFMEALQTAIVDLAAHGERISFLMSKSRLLSDRVKATLQETWKNQRGIEIQSVAIMSLAYDASSQSLINLRNAKNMSGRGGTTKRCIRCDKCGFEPPAIGPVPRFCPQCGDPITGADYPQKG